MATRNQRERRAPERYGVISLGIPFDGVNSDLELEEEEIEQAGELGSSTNPVYSSSEDELEEPRRKRRRRGRERTETSSVRQHVNSSESDGNDTDSSSNLFAEDSNDEDFEGFPNRTFEWREPVGEINAPPACVQATGAKTELPEDASAAEFFFFSESFFLTWNCLNTLFVKQTDLLSKAKLKQRKETRFGLTL